MPICVRMAPGVEVLIQLLDEPPGLCGPVSGLLSGVHKAIRYLHARTGWGGVLQGLNAIAIRNLIHKTSLPCGTQQRSQNMARGRSITSGNNLQMRCL